MSLCPFSKFLADTIEAEFSFFMDDLKREAFDGSGVGEAAYPDFFRGVLCVGIFVHAMELLMLGCG